MPRDPWLLVSKPLVPPLRDGTTVLVHTLVHELPHDHPVAYFGDPAAPVRAAKLDRVLPAPAMGYAPGLLAKAKILGAVMRPAHAKLPLHFFFTPNRVTSSVLSGLRRAQRGRRMLQSVMSSDNVERFVPWLAPLDAVVVGSDHTRERLIRAGLPAARVHRIHPGVHVPAQAVADPAHPPEGRRLLYAGDLDAAVVDRILALAPLLRRPELADWTFTVACRPKGDDDAAQRRRLREAVADLEADGRIDIRAEVDDMDALLRSTSLQLFLADHVRKKVDLPLVLLEGMARGVGVALLDVAPVHEILHAGRRHDLRPGIALTADDPAGLAPRLADILVDEAALRRLGADARRLVELDFSAPRMTAQYLALYENPPTRETSHDLHQQ